MLTVLLPACDDKCQLSHSSLFAPNAAQRRHLYKEKEAVIPWINTSLYFSLVSYFFNGFKPFLGDPRHREAGEENKSCRRGSQSLCKWIVNVISVKNLNNYKLEKHFAFYVCLFHEDRMMWIISLAQSKCHFTAGNNTTTFVADLLEPIT